MSRDFHQLKVWQMGMQLVREVYESTAAMPKEEIYGLTSQMRRSAVSIPSNIAEGHGRWTENEFLHYLIQARGSLMELQTQMIIAGDLNFIKPQVIKELITNSEILAKSINSLMESIRLQIKAKR